VFALLRGTAWVFVAAPRALGRCNSKLWSHHRTMSFGATGVRLRLSFLGNRGVVKEARGAHQRNAPRTERKEQKRGGKPISHVNRDSISG